MRALAATYFLAVALAMPAALLAADDPPAAETTPAPAETAPAEPAPAEQAEEEKGDKAKADEEPTKTKDLAPVARAAASQSVQIKGFKYSPVTVTVNVGDTIRWTNQDTAPHTATADDGSFDTGNLDKGDSGTESFDKAGTFDYICTIHPSMKAKVVVRASAAGDETGSSGSSDSGSSDDADPFAPSTDEDAADDTSSLADTGLDVALVALAGFLLLGGGMILRRQLR